MADLIEWEYAGSYPQLAAPPCPECKRDQHVVVLMLPTSESYGQYDCSKCRLTFSAAPKEWVKAYR